MWVAETHREVGLALFDYKSPAHFGIGVLAGVLGMNPHLAALLMIAAKAGKVALEEGLGRALFTDKDPESYGNEMMDLLMEMGGIFVGLKARSLITGKPVLPADGLGDKVVGYEGNTWYQAAAGPAWTPMPFDP